MNVLEFTLRVMSSVVGMLSGILIAAGISLMFEKLERRRASKGYLLFYFKIEDEGGLSSTQCTRYTDKKVGSIGCSSCSEFMGYHPKKNAVKCKRGNS